MSAAERLANLQTRRATPILDPRDPMKSTRTFVDQYYTEGQWRTLHHWTGDFYDWTGAAYRPLNDDTSRAALYRFLDAAQCQTPDGQLAPFRPTTQKVNLVLDALRAIANLPPGDYVIEAWHETSGTQTQSITVAPNETAAASISFGG